MKTTPTLLLFLGALFAIGLSLRDSARAGAPDPSSLPGANRARGAYYGPMP